MKVYYRLSNKNAGISKVKLPHATKEHCLNNCVSVFGKEAITVVGDNLNKETEQMVQDLSLELVNVSNGSGAGTFRDALNLAIQDNRDDEVIYLLEDDFLHTPNANKIIEEGAVIDSASVVTDYWSKRTIAGLFLMPATRHNIVHLNEALQLKKRSK